MKKTNNTRWAKFVEKLKKFFGKVDKILFPSNIKCLNCNTDLPEKQEIEFCEKCLKNINFITEDKCCKVCGTILKSSNICNNCSTNKREFDIARSVCVYDGMIAMMMASYKYHNKPYICSTFGEMLARKYNNLGWKVDCVIAVPITKKRKKQRGFNQAQLMAEKFCKKTGLPLLEDVLIKTKENEHQAALGFKERQENIKESYKIINKRKIAGKNILIIDDVLTTGATTGACAHVLKEAKAKSVSVLCVASTKFDKEFENSKDNKVFKVLKQKEKKKKGKKIKVSNFNNDIMRYWFFQILT